jgi:long-chain acyl-CoA synthetase
MEREVMIGTYDLLRLSGLNTPDKTAVVFEGQRCSYRELISLVDALAEKFAGIGIHKGSVTGVLFSNGIDWVVVFYALLKLQACVAPITSRLTAEEIKELLIVADCEFFFYEDKYSNLIDDLSKELADDSAITFFSEKDLEAQAGIAVEFLPVKSEDPILSIFTGGSTGSVKAAIHTQYSIVMQAVSGFRNQVAPKNDDVMLNYAPLFHLGGLSSLINVLAIGGTLVLTKRFDEEEILQLIETERVTKLLLIPPTIITRFSNDVVNSYDLSSVEVVFLTGGASNAAIAEKIFELLPQVRLFNGYGQTEQAIRMTNLINKEQFTKYPERIDSVGIPDEFFEVRLVDDESNDVAKGACGEAWGKSPCMFQGYKGVESELVDGWFATGDLFYQDEEGYYYFQGRKKNMIKSGGENIYAVEVERVIAKHPAVLEYAVIGLPDTKLGEMVVAAIVSEREDLTEEEIIAFCVQNMASFKKPGKVYFLPELPKSKTGKVNLAALRENLLEQHTRSER